MHPILNIVVRATRKAGNYIANSLSEHERIELTQKNIKKLISEKKAEAIIVNNIKNSYPEHSIFSEESGFLKGKKKHVCWIIVPISGSKNFEKKLPHFSISIAVRIKDRTEFACVYDPIRNELFTAQRGCGAQLNNTRIRVKEFKKIKGSIIATGFSFEKQKYCESYIKTISSLMINSADLRCTGSSALDLCYLAAGRFDGYFQLGLKFWQIAAGELIARESGAILTDFSGGTKYIESGNLVGSNSGNIKNILKHIIHYNNISLEE
ncbi:inositol-1-monophosphatase [Candidatus Photodesmus blepharus]|uniref:Inositol-1-monophosphatase n=1 Tax=Candidatus Photodesmus blepharonis TaxID=1179155 RepID=A0A084CPH0_9GAMM|nr:inositol monophosphatase family protein [Candidatus Photodesmus blepharus]KEY91699.1 inositol-1-monophosphatase [Candidatus Photodesmus blepharus]